MLIHSIISGIFLPKKILYVAAFNACIGKKILYSMLSYLTIRGFPPNKKRGCKYLIIMVMIKKLYTYIMALPAFVTSPPTPTCPANQDWTDLGCVHTDPVGFVGQFYGYGLSLIGGVSLLFILYAGYLIIFSQGNPETLQKGKRYLAYSIIGLALAIFGFVFVQTIAVDILHIPGFQ